MYDVEGRRRLLLRGTTSHKTVGPRTARDTDAVKRAEAPAAALPEQAAEDRDSDALSVDPRRISDMWDQQGNR